VTIAELKAEALRLNPKERAELASEPLVSLDALCESEIEKLRLEYACGPLSERAAEVVTESRGTLSF